MCELLFILQRISVTNIILSNTVYDISIVRLLLRSLKFCRNHLYMVIFFLFLLLIFYLFYLIIIYIGLLVPLNGIKKYLAWPDKSYWEAADYRQT